MIIFCTHVNPDKNDQLPITKAFNMFLKELCIDSHIIFSELNSNNSSDVKLKINTTGASDYIKVDNKHTFLRSIFITNKNFQHKVEAHYNKQGLYVESPQKIGDSIYIIRIIPYTPYKKYQHDTVYNKFRYLEA